MIKQLYAPQDMISRQWAQPFVGENDEQVARDMLMAFAYRLMEGNFAIRDVVVLAVACVELTDDAFKIIPYDVPHRVCGGTDAEVDKIVERLRLLSTIEPTGDEEEISANA